MKYYINKKFFLLEKKILKRISTTKNNKLIVKLLVNKLIFLTLKIENILFDHNNLKNPQIIIKKDIEDLYDFICEINKLAKFSKQESVKLQKFSREKNHKRKIRKIYKKN